MIMLATREMKINPKMLALHRLVAFRASKTAIDTINGAWEKQIAIPTSTLDHLTQLIVIAAVNGDQAAASWLALLKWKPNQLRN